jgi:L-aminopeptidase/D-esterase-like protein
LNDTLTAIEGLSVGHWSDPVARTGCTVVLCPPEGCLASGLAMGASPASRETDLLAPEKTVGEVHAILLSGGSAFGLAAADGVMRWLAREDRGYPTPGGRVPIVPAACIYDLGSGLYDRGNGGERVYPDAASGWAAVAGASSNPVEQGSVGAGIGATVGNLGGGAPDRGGLGSALVQRDGISVAALAVSNPAGSVLDPATGAVVAGPAEIDLSWLSRFQAGTNTTLAVVATDARLDKGAARAIAQSAHFGIARVTRPSHTPGDGDTVFVLSTGTGPQLSGIGLIPLAVHVQEVVAAAIVRGVRTAAQQSDS